MKRQEHRRVMRCSGNCRQGGCCLRLGTDSHQKAAVRDQAGPARHGQSSHGDQGCLQLQRVSPGQEGPGHPLHPSLTPCSTERPLGFGHFGRRKGRGWSTWLLSHN